ncbi:hypothetical protein ACFL2S_10215 [Thermodesulfobacteriota bacterium]
MSAIDKLFVFIKARLSKVLLSLIFVLLAVLISILPIKPKTETIKVSEDKTITVQHNNGAKLLEWASLLFLALAIWTWRKELNITGIGFLSGSPPIEQKTPEDFQSESNQEKKLESYTNDTSSIFTEMREQKFTENRNWILNYLKHQYALTAQQVAYELKISRASAEALVYTLVKEGKIRQDGFPRKTLYTYASSFENLAIDLARAEIESDHKIISERRYVKFRGTALEADAVIECVNVTFIVEVKVYHSGRSLSDSNRTINRLIKIADQYHRERVILFLVFVTHDDKSTPEIKVQIEHTTFDTNNIPLKISVYSSEDLKIEKELIPGYRRSP